MTFATFTVLMGITGGIHPGVDNCSKKSENPKTHKTKECNKKIIKVSKKKINESRLDAISNRDQINLANKKAKKLNEPTQPQKIKLYISNEERTWEKQAKKVRMKLLRDKKKTRLASRSRRRDLKNQFLNPDMYFHARLENEGFDQEGYNRKGLARHVSSYPGPFELEESFSEYDSDGFDRFGYDERGYDRYGFNILGYDCNGYDTEGYDCGGFDKDGYDFFGYDYEGYDVKGFDQYGVDKVGYDIFGFGEDGYDREGLDHHGYNKEGFDSRGYDFDGIDRLGNKVGQSYFKKKPAPAKNNQLNSSLPELNYEDLEGMVMKQRVRYRDYV